MLVTNLTPSLESLCFLVHRFRRNADVVHFSALLLAGCLVGNHLALDCGSRSPGSISCGAQGNFFGLDPCLVDPAPSVSMDYTSGLYMDYNSSRPSEGMLPLSFESLFWGFLPLPVQRSKSFTVYKSPQRKLQSVKLGGTITAVIKFD